MFKVIMLTAVASAITGTLLFNSAYATSLSNVTTNPFFVTQLTADITIPEPDNAEELATADNENTDAQDAHEEDAHGEPDLDEETADTDDIDLDPPAPDSDEGEGDLS
jgi:hypothetical protein